MVTQRIGLLLLMILICLRVDLVFLDTPTDILYRAKVTDKLTMVTNEKSLRAV